MTSTLRFARNLVVAAVVVASVVLANIFGCSPPPAPISQSMADPSNPAAPEGTTATVSSSMAPLATKSTGSPHEHDHAHQHESAPMTGHDGDAGKASDKK